MLNVLQLLILFPMLAVGAMTLMLAWQIVIYCLGRILKKLELYSRKKDNEMMNSLQRDNEMMDQKDLDNCWQDPPEDVKQMIVERMSFSGRVRLSCLNKSWRLAALQRDIRALNPWIWLVHPHSYTEGTYSDSLSFSSLSEGRVFELWFRKPVLEWGLSAYFRTIFLMSSKGWLIMLKAEADYSFRLQLQVIILLVNPITGAQHRLPYLTTLPLTIRYREKHAIQTVELSSPDISQCMAAAIINDHHLALCRPRDKSWSVFHVIDANNMNITRLMFSSTGILYALVTGSLDIGGVNEERTLKFGDHEVKLKLIYVKPRWWIDDASSDLRIPPYSCNSYLLEAANNEVLLIHQIFYTQRVNGDENNAVVLEANVEDDQGNNVEEVNDMGDNEENGSIVKWTKRMLHYVWSKAVQLIPLDEEDIVCLKTNCFRVYKIGPDDNFHRVQNLKDQVLFVADDGSSLSFLASDFPELQGNCIYFAARGSDLRYPHTSGDIGIFYLDNGRIEPIPNFDIPEQPDLAFSLSWFTPSMCN